MKFFLSSPYQYFNQSFICLLLKNPGDPFVITAVENFFGLSVDLFPPETRLEFPYQVSLFLYHQLKLLIKMDVCHSKGLQDSGMNSIDLYFVEVFRKTVA